MNPTIIYNNRKHTQLQMTETDKRGREGIRPKEEGFQWLMVGYETKKNTINRNKG